MTMSLNSDEKLQQQTIEDLPPNLKLDEHGLPLVPQPTDHVDDPLVMPSKPTTFPRLTG